MNLTVKTGPKIGAEKREMDFLIMEGKRLVHFIECKSFGKEASPSSLCYLKARFPSASAVQVGLDKDVDIMTKEGVRVCSAQLFLKDLV
jgi:hypothetical protein